nr:TPA_asm: M52 uORF RNA *1 [Murid betaherpesvirus 1]DBA07794.1 TPA_asm: M52 uORF RNA *1 [Murid betaherpesvirus 1]
MPQKSGVTSADVDKI